MNVYQSVGLLLHILWRSQVYVAWDTFCKKERCALWTLDWYKEMHSISIFTLHFLFFCLCITVLWSFWFLFILICIHYWRKHCPIFLIHLVMILHHIDSSCTKKTFFFIHPWCNSVISFLKNTKNKLKWTWNCHLAATTTDMGFPHLAKINSKHEYIKEELRFFYKTGVLCVLLVFWTLTCKVVFNAYCEYYIWAVYTASRFNLTNQRMLSFFNLYY